METLETNKKNNNNNNNNIEDHHQKCCSSWWWLFKTGLISKYDKVLTDIAHIIQLTKQLALDDPRRIIHSLKVGLAISVVSIFYYFDPLFQGFGVSAMWAVLTVVVVFEFSVGATLGKGVNRVLATIFGGMCGAGAHKLATLLGPKLEPFLIALFVFLVAGMTTFIRFYPKMKAKFDYGVLVFILTFCLVSVSGYRESEVIDTAQRRIITILIGSSTAAVVCVLIWPVWAGNDLHNLTANNLEQLSLFYQEYSAEYFNVGSDETWKDDDKMTISLDELKSVLDSKPTIDSLVNFANWEPRHGRFRQKHPWTQYKKIGEVTRHCAFWAQALHGYLHSQVQAPTDVKKKFQEQCTKMSIESSKALKELASSISKMRPPTKAKPHIKIAKQASQDLKLLLTSTLCKNLNLSDVTPVATMASLLGDSVDCVEEIEVVVQELATLANFKHNVGEVDKILPENKRINQLINEHKGSMKRRCSRNNHVILIEGSSPHLSPRFSASQGSATSLSMSHQSAVAE